MVMWYLSRQISLKILQQEYFQSKFTVFTAHLDKPQKLTLIQNTIGILAT